MKNYSYREPIEVDLDGTYITEAQMQFFLNQKGGEQQALEAGPKFLEFVNLCRVYNTVFDMMEEDEESAIMYWDEKRQVISMGFPAGGKVAKTLSSLTMRQDVPTWEEEMEEDEDEWGLFKDN